MNNNRVTKEELLINILEDIDAGKELKQQNYGLEKQEYGDIVDMLRDSGFLKGAIVTRGGQGNKVLFVDLSTAKITIPGLQYLKSKKVLGEDKMSRDYVQSKKVFVSNSGEDEEIIKYFIEKILIAGIGFHPEDIFCSSQPGMKPDPGAEWTKQILEGIKSCDVVFAVITPNFKTSEVCLNEIGASWVLDKFTIILCVEPVKQWEATVLYSTSQVEELLNEEGLDRVKDVIDKKGFVKKVRTDRWNQSKKDFVTLVKRYILKHPFKKVVTNEEYEKLLMKFNELDGEYSKLYDENSTLIEINQKLSECKNMEDVKRIKDEYKETTKVEEIIELIKEANQILKKFHPSIITLIYNSYSGSNLPIEYEENKKYIEEAIGNQIIDSDDLSVSWYNDSKLERLSAILDKLNLEFKELDEENYNAVSEEYDNQELKVKKLDFWRNVLNAKMYY